MRSQLIVKTDPVSNRLPGLAAGFQLSQGDALPFHRAPQAFDEDIVHPPALAIHGNGYVGVLEGLGEFLAGKLWFIAEFREKQP